MTVGDGRYCQPRSGSERNRCDSLNVPVVGDAVHTRTDQLRGRSQTSAERNCLRFAAVKHEVSLTIKTGECIADVDANVIERFRWRTQYSLDPSNSRLVGLFPE